MKKILLLTLSLLLLAVIVEGGEIVGTLDAPTEFRGLERAAWYAGYMAKEDDIRELRLTYLAAMPAEPYQDGAIYNGEAWVLPDITLDDYETVYSTATLSNNDYSTIIFDQDNDAEYIIDAAGFSSLTNDEAIKLAVAIELCGKLLSDDLRQAICEKFIPQRFKVKKESK